MHRFRDTAPFQWPSHGGDWGDASPHLSQGPVLGFVQIRWEVGVCGGGLGYHSVPFNNLVQSRKNAVLRLSWRWHSCQIFLFIFFESSRHKCRSKRPCNGDSDVYTNRETVIKLGPIQPRIMDFPGRVFGLGSRTALYPRVDHPILVHLVSSVESFHHVHLVLGMRSRRRSPNFFLHPGVGV